MHGMLFDLPHAFEGGQRLIAEAGLASRCGVVSGDFFVSDPAGAEDLPSFQSYSRLERRKDRRDLVIFFKFTRLTAHMHPSLQAVFRNYSSLLAEIGLSQEEFEKCILAIGVGAGFDSEDYRNVREQIDRGAAPGKILTNRADVSEMNLSL
jgi:hypothetical protein